jgi:heme/copper-type cytochrome/quinol oxidase subunit 2
MKIKTNIPLALAFIIVVVVFLLLCGGAITMTLMNSEMNKNGMMNNISWMWIPATIALLLSVLLGWVLFTQKNSNE